MKLLIDAVCFALLVLSGVVMMTLAGCGGSSSPPTPPQPVCGNHQCESGESGTNCCEDCGCAAGATCQSNTCVKPDRCGDGQCGASENSTNCCEDCGCASGSSCKSGSCAPDAVCGDGTCGAGEDASNCCQDCGCDLGYTCRSSGCAYVGTATLTWSMDDLCLDGVNIEAVIFDEDANLASDAFYLTPGQTESLALVCTVGHTVCFGGSQPGTYWGVDVDNSESCTNCCLTCVEGTTTFNPSCN